MLHMLNINFIFVLFTKTYHCIGESDVLIQVYLEWCPWVDIDGKVLYLGSFGGGGRDILALTIFLKSQERANKKASIDLASVVYIGSSVWHWLC